jgi:hypothetical protein
VAARPAYESWYVALEPGGRTCALVAHSPLRLPALRLLATRHYNLLAVTASRPLYIYRVAAPGC